MFLTATKIQKCVIKLLIFTVMHYNFFLNAIRLKKCVIEQFIDVFFVFYSIPDQYKPKEIGKLVVSLYFPTILYCPYKYITQEICDEAFDDSLAA